VRNIGIGFIKYYVQYLYVQLTSYDITKNMEQVDESGLVKKLFKTFLALKMKNGKILLYLAYHKKSRRTKWCTGR